MAKSIFGTLFGDSQAELFRDGAWPDEPVVGHGPLSRLPVEMSSGVLSNLESLAAAYQGKLSVGKNIGQRQKFLVMNGSAPRAAHDYFLTGLTIIFDDVTNVAPSIAPWMSQLETEVGSPPGLARLVGFASPKGKNRGVQFHWDAREGVLIQLQGRKRIRVAPNRDIAHPSRISPGVPIPEELAVQLPRRFPDWPKQSQVIDLHPGSVIFMPRGYWHATEPVDDSLLIAIDFAWPTMVDILLPCLRLHLLQQEKWRRPVIGAWRDSKTFSDASVEVSRLLNELPADIRELRPVDILSGTRNIETRFKFIGPDTRFLRHKEIRSKMKRAGKAFNIDLEWTRGFGKTTLEIENRFAPAFKWVLERKGKFTASQVAVAFPRLPFATVQQVLKLLFSADAIQFAGSGPSQKTARPAR